MNIIAALRAACLADPGVRALLRTGHDGEGVYAEGSAPADDPGPLVIVRFLSGGRVAGCDSSSARVQLDAWAAGAGAAERVVELGRALEAALAALPAASFAGVVLAAVRPVDDANTERHEPDDDAGDVAGDPAWVFSFEVQVLAHPEE